MTDFAAIIIRMLADANVDFLLVGGVAATLHGSSRLTRDVEVGWAISICSARSPGAADSRR